MLWAGSQAGSKVHSARHKGAQVLIASDARSCTTGAAPRPSGKRGHWEGMYVEVSNSAGHCSKQQQKPEA